MRLGRARKPATPLGLFVSSVVVFAGTLALSGMLCVPSLFIRPSQYATLKASGVAVAVSIESCSEGSKGSITCTGSFPLDGLQYSENVLGIGYVASPGTLVPCLVDPKNPSDVYPTSDVYANAGVGLDVVVWIGLVTGLTGLVVSAGAWRAAFRSKRELGGWSIRPADAQLV